MFVQCVRVVQSNGVKVQCGAYRKVGVCCRVYSFLLKIMTFMILKIMILLKLYFFTWIKIYLKH